MGKRQRTENTSKEKRPTAVNQNWLELKSKLHLNFKKRKNENVRPPEKTVLQKLPEPTNPDCSVTKVIAMDCEMVGVGFDGKKSILARVSMVNEFGNVIYDEYVKPMEFVTDFRTHVSGIRYKDIKNGKEFSEVQKRVAELLSGRIVVGHALHHDFKVLLLDHPKSDTRDTCLYGPLRSDLGKPRSLRHLAELFLDAKVQDGSHSSVEDARAAMLLYQKFKVEWEKSMFSRKRFKRQKV